VLSELHLRRVLRTYLAYYNVTRFALRPGDLDFRQHLIRVERRGAPNRRATKTHSRVFRRVLRRAGLPAFRVYDLRHAGKLLADGGARVIQIEPTNVR
jgi:hypothetical protein